MIHLRKIVIKTIDHKDQRYDTCGDYWIDEQGTLQMRISRTNDKYEFLIMIHELIEQFLTEQHGIAGEDIDKFDMEYEKNRTHKSLKEPGDNYEAPYYIEHQFATGIERVLANEVDVNWREYDRDIDAL